MEASTSPINAPHPDEPSPDDFFGDGDGGAPEEPTTQAEREATAEFEVDANDPAASGAVSAAEQPSPAPPPEQPVETPPAEPAPAPASAEEGRASGSQARGYVVLRQVTLTPDVLRKLLEEAESHGVSEYRNGWFLLDENLEGRNVKHALSTAFNKHQENIGPKPRLVALTERAWQPKTIQPKQRTVESLDFT